MSTGTSVSGAEGLKYRDASARRDAVLDVVRREGFCRVVDLSALLGVSRITVRRDIALLEQENLVRSAHGGVIAPLAAGHGTHFQLRRLSNANAKRAIARKAIEYISQDPPGTIGIDAGTTSLEAARFLAPTAPLTVITHSLPVMVEVAERTFIEVVGIGGVLHRETQAFAGSSTVSGYGDIRLDVAILTASAVRDNIMFCGNVFDADTKRQMLSVADKVMLLVDSSKFEGVAPFQVANLDGVDIIVVDHETPPVVLKELEGHSFEVIVAEPSE
jgi:DeoR/GlpR family transcriptional regulator of sugar metabolism